MGFVIEWLWYLLAFLAGTVVAWLIALVAVKPTSRDEALVNLVGWREKGAR